MKPVKVLFMKFKEDQVFDLIKRLLTVFVLLYLFLVGVNCLSDSLKLMGGGFAETLFSLTGQPFVSLMAGMLATVLFQSSSVTTSIIVGLVSSGSLSIAGAVPMIMGANLGTSVTNTLVSLGYMKNTANFKKAFAAATVHDFFNILTVVVLLPIELMTGFIEKSSIYLSSLMYGSFSGLKYSSPIKAAIKPPTKMIKGFVIDTFGTDMGGIAMMILSGVIIIAALTLIVKTMQVLIESHKGELINRALSKNGFGSILFGAGMTVAVQSSSITTSLLIPMAGSGLLTMQSIYPITLGANIGTTGTALLAALSGNAAGLSIALVHLLFNVIGTMIFYPIPFLRELPIRLSNALAETIDRTKFIGIGYVGTVFFALPISMIYLVR